MSGWIEIKEGKITLIHHSTSSAIEMVLEEDDGEKNSFWFDYYQFEDLKKAIKRVEQ